VWTLAGAVALVIVTSARAGRRVEGVVPPAHD